MSDSPPPPPAHAPVAPPAAIELAGFWRRLAAFLLDALILMLVGSALGLCFGSFFRMLGPMGRIVGFFVASLYFAALDGPLGGGRTPGKRLMGLRVTGADGGTPDWMCAAVRGVLLGAVIALNGYAAEPDMKDPIDWALYALLLAVLATAYLVAFERRRRQGLHDLAANSFVVRASSGWTEPPPASGAQRTAAGLLAVALAVVGYFGQKRMLETEFFKPMLAARAAVRAHVGPLPVGVTRNRLYVKGQVRDILQITIFYYDPPEDPAQTALEVARAALESGYPSEGLSGVGVNIQDGYTTGLSNLVHGHTYIRSVNSWLTKPAHDTPVQRTTTQDASALAQAALDGRVDELERLLKTGSDPNERSSDGDTPLLSAAAHGRTDSARVLLDYSASADVVNEKGNTPLMYAASAGNAELVTMLLSHRCSTDGKEAVFGKTALLSAAAAGHADVVRLLLDARANPNLPDKDGHSPLWYAKQNADKAMIALLTSAGAKD